MKRKLTKRSSPRSARKRRPILLGGVDDVAKHLNISIRWVNQLAAAEGLPRKSHGVYDIVACLRWYVQYLHQKIADRQKQDGGDTTSAAIRHKTLSIDAEIKQLELAKDREQLVSRDSVDKDFAALVVEIRTRARAVSPRIAHELLGETDLATAQVKIDAGLKRFLEELSQFDLDVV